ncbi:MAG: hypothetical protein LH632_01085 [Rhodoferax sp.]|nr:hypothetical protein [Rhodoferax sp.]
MDAGLAGAEQGTPLLHRRQANRHHQQAERYLREQICDQYGQTAAVAGTREAAFFALLNPV